MGYLKWELKDFFNNKKNILIYFLILIVSIYFAVYLTKSYEVIESVNLSEIESRYEDRKSFLGNVKIDEGTHPMTAFAAYAFPKANELDKERLDALKNKDLKKYAEATSEWYEYTDEIIYTNDFDGLKYNPQYYTYGNKFARYDGHYAYQSEAKKYEAYSKSKYELSENVFNQKTALQFLERALDNGMIQVLLLLSFILSNDIITKDKKHPSLVNGLPLSPLKKIFYKSIVALIGITTTLILLIPSFLIIGIKNGFGSFSLPVVKYYFAFLNTGTYESVSMWRYLVEVFALLILWWMIIIGLIILFSIIFRNEYVNLALTLILLAPALYLQRGTIINEKLSYLFTTYMDISKSVKGYSNYLFMMETPSFNMAILVLSITLLVIILFVLIISKNIKKLI